MWGSNARDAHPIFFHHVLAGVRNGAKLYVVDPRRTSTAQFADLWLGLHVGTDIALSNTIAREIIAAGLVNTDVRRARHDRATTSTPRRWRSGRSSAARRSPASRPRRSASWPTPTPRPTGPSCAGRSASPSTTTPSTTCSPSSTWPCCAATSGGGDRASTRCAGRTTCRAAATWAPCRTSCPASRTSRTTRPGASSTPRGTSPCRRATAGTSRDMFAAMRRGDLRALYVIGENPAQSEAESAHAVELLEGPRPPRRAGHLPHQDGAARRRRAAGLGVVVREQRHRHQLRATGAARAQGARPARRGTRRRAHPDRPGRASSATTGTTATTTSAPSGCGTSCAACRRCTPG